MLIYLFIFVILPPNKSSDGGTGSKITIKIVFPFIHLICLPCHESGIKREERAYRQVVIVGLLIREVQVVVRISLK